MPLGSNADAVLARRWTPEAKGYVFGSRNWNSFRSAWESALAAAGVDDPRFHDLRHTHASWLIQRGRTLRKVQEAPGHQTITMTMRYSRLAPDHCAQLWPCSTMCFLPGSSLSPPRFQRKVQRKNSFSPVRCLGSPRSTW